MNHHLRIVQVWHVFSRDLTVLPAHPHVLPQSEWAKPAFAFPATAGTHLPTVDEWKAELAQVAGYVLSNFTCPKAVTHPTTNWARCTPTALIKTTLHYTKLPQWLSLVDLLTLTGALSQRVRTTRRQHAWYRRLRHCLQRMSALVYFSS